MKKVKINWKVLIVSLVVVYAIALIGSLFTSGNVDTSWYESVKPSITPANWVFPIVWNILFFLIALSLYFAWIKASKKEKNKVAWVFGINLFLNAFWSYLFFYLKRPTYAYLELIVLWVSIWIMISVTKRIDKKAAWLLVPYLLWVLFAGVLNYLIAFG